MKGIVRIRIVLFVSVVFWITNLQIARAQCGCYDCPVALPDNTTTLYTATVVVYNSSNNTLGVNNSLQQVCVDVDHSYIGDLDITLTAPDGTSVILYADGNNNFGLGGSETNPFGNASNNLDVCFVLPGSATNIFGAMGAGACTDAIYTDPCNGVGLDCYDGIWGTYDEGCLGGNGIGTFNNGTGTASGTWTISINDNANGDAGILYDVTLTFATAPDSCGSIPPPPAPLCGNSTLVAIPDATGVPASSVIANTGSVGLMGAGTDIVNVCILIDHTWIGDLDIWLYEPDGSGVNLSNYNGGTSDDYGEIFSGTQMCFTPSSTSPISGYFGGQTGDFMPEDPFTTFDGTPNGDWTLSVWDDFGIIAGSLISWSIEFGNGNCANFCTYNYSISDYFCTGSTYDFNGTILSNPGTYVDSFAVAGGCDSIVTLNLTEESVDYVVVGVDLCPGDSATISGIVYYSADGNYTETLAGTYCDSVVTLKIFVDSFNTAIVNASVCNGDLYTLPNGGQVGAAGTYLDTTISPTGCIRVITTNLSVDPVVSLINDVTICPGESTVVGGNSYSVSGTYIDTLTSGLGCDSIITTNLTVSSSTNPLVGLFAASHTDYHMVDPLTGALLSTYATSPQTVGWLNGSFTIHQQGEVLYWLSESADLQSLDLGSGVQSSLATDLKSLPFYWSLRYYNGYIYAVSTSGDQDKMLVRIDPATGLLDVTFPGIEIDNTADMSFSGGSSPVIDPVRGRLYISMSSNKLLEFDINTLAGAIISLTGFSSTPPSINLLEINESTGTMYALSGFNTVVSISITGATTANVASIKTLTSGAGFTNPTSTFDAGGELFIFQAEFGCGAQNPLITVDINTGQEWCSDPPGVAFTQMEFLNCSPSSVLRVEGPSLFDQLER